MSFFNYDAKLKSLITLGTLVHFFSLAMLVFLDHVLAVKNFHQILRYFFYILATLL